MIEYLLLDCHFCGRELVADKHYSLEEYQQIRDRCGHIAKVKARIGNVCICEDCLFEWQQVIGNFKYDEDD